ncbi:SDR family NAD(P)-dependent oxidoreductase [Paramaledivibacter caminithermalis]|jgi:NAD(P)-dependent dehydrogenase (short-subunit alcohol dehydrogenase family)|uniref:NAD(P)-dependent dehydrogenase, short-chain alcohol dehydrogenase family n=1 Tax=Paramaledivibacter caminithermalis (strain DSM 15212 / CIP 107654 / DViRD3) TaxID=1121301 RepID=A0A1M6QBA5_PARC5|nr:SDR family oxidoreductase [Paramaledivibacter caminithermalis]SHK17446.1 NAD(P)-dependent dehydrogenase, short-chain alcohol dehydrogenase family [Paramaledivibacter caminithermalis DSM 15212]
MLQKKDLLSLEGKVAVITGAASGIGLGTAQLLSAYGAYVAMLDVNPKGEEEAQKIRQEGRIAQFYKCDVTSIKEVEDTVNAIKENYGRIDILFNNAGVTVRKTIVDLEEKEWDFVIDVGLKGTFLLSKFVIPVMAQGGGGSIINTGSGWGLKGGDRAAAYCAVKGGIVNLTRAMAIDHGPQNIRVNSVNPGDTDTAMLRDEGVQTGVALDENTMNKYLEECGIDRPLKRIGIPEDIANAVLFLASDLSSWITGAALVVDGGGIA